MHFLVGLFAIYCVMESEGSKLPAWLDTTKKTMQGPIPTARRGHAICGYEGVVFIFGGRSQNLERNDLFAVEVSEMISVNLTSLSTGTSPLGRSSFSMAVIKDRFYILGGWSLENFADDMIEYDMGRMTWTILPPMALDRSSHRAAVAPAANGEGSWMYVFGGGNGENETLSNLVAYDPVARRWHNLAGAGEPTARAEHGLAEVGGRLLVFGGSCETELCLDDLHAYDTLSGAWVNLLDAAGPRPPSRFMHGFVGAAGRAYLFGGICEVFMDDFFAYDPNQHAWHSLNSAGTRPTARFGHAMASDTHRIYVHGGFGWGTGELADLFVYDLQVQRWTDLTAASLHAPPLVGQGLGFAAGRGGGELDGRLWVHGGRYFPGPTTKIWLASGMHAYDPFMREWIEIQPDNTDASDGGDESSALLPRFFHGFAAADDGRLYVHAGSGPDTVLHDLHAYDPFLRVWENLSVPAGGEPPLGRLRHGLTSVGRRLYVHGGSDIHRNLLDDLHAYDIDNRTWMFLGPGSGAVVGGVWPGARAWHGFASDGQDRLYVFGGISAILFGDLHILDTRAQALTWWQPVASGAAPTPRYGHGFTGEGGCVFVLGGFNSHVVLADLRRFCHATLAWTTLTPAASEAAPVRYDFCLVVSGQRFYALGGKSASGLVSLAMPKDTFWARGLVDFISLYDWDRLLLVANLTMPALTLCSGILPCRLTIIGHPSDAFVVRRDGAASIACLASLGCSALTLSGVRLVCGGEWTAPLLRAQGCILSIYNCSFSGCSSASDGAVLQAYNDAAVQVSGSQFRLCQSQGRGGCIAILRSVLEVFDCRFEHCTAELGGGGIWAGARPNDFDEASSQSTLVLRSSTFHNCSTVGQGGAILASAEVLGSVLVRIALSDFLRCHAGADGGAVRAVGEGVEVHVKNSSFSSCLASGCGGAVSAAASAELGLHSVIAINNVAWGLGGGAVHLFGARYFQHICSFTGNMAPSGGGGVLLWRGSVAPARSLAACPSGLVLVEVSCAENIAGDECRFSTCLACPPGTWLAEGVEASTCWECPAGSYSAVQGSSSCAVCAAGWFSAKSAATHPSVCERCCAGSYASEAGSSLCFLCPVGSYAGANGSSSCDVCPAGQYATVSGAVSAGCMDCQAGSFSDPGSSSCRLCAAGTYASSALSTACVECDAGTFSGAPAATSFDACISCLTGLFSVAAASECSVCPAGSYSTALSATDCLLCPAGSITTGDLSSNPTACTLCAPGLFLDNEGSSWCLECSIGWYTSSPGSQGCLSCSPGTYSEELGSSGCSLCPAGTFAGLLSADSCEPCSSGSYASGEGTSACDYCAVGSYSSAVNATDSSTCCGCPEGTYASETAASACTMCSAGSFASYRGSSICRVCEPGHFSILEGSTEDGCQACEAGSMSSAPGASSCRLCDLGRFSNQSGASACAECPAGRSASSFDPLCTCLEDHQHMVCKPCYPGFYSSSAGATKCSVCASGMFAQSAGESDCTSCWGLPSDARAESTLRNSLIPPTALTAGRIEDFMRPKPNFPSPRNGCAMSPPHADASLDLLIATSGILSQLIDFAMFPSRGKTARPKIMPLDVPSTPPPRSKPSRRAAEYSGLLPDFIVLSCGDYNMAGYGSCLASTSVSLELTVVYPQPANQAYVGLPLALEVWVLDAHGQRVTSDSESFLACKVGLGPDLRADEALSAVGDTVFQLATGRAAPVLTVHASFTAGGGVAAALRDEVYVAVSGSDARTGESLLSTAQHIRFAGGTAVCPPGFVLRLDAAAVGASGRAGSCVECTAGSYSVDPLTSPAFKAAEPACFNCPVAASCPGGSTVAFKAGMWVISQGMYILVNCPRGSQLINSVGGSFSHDVQQCVACQASEYILASNSSRFACQPCPVGARCDGAVLVTAVNESVWVPDTALGLYVLASCPPGYELLNRLSSGEFSPVNQECRACPAFFYCLGGSAARSPCHAGMFSPPGSNNSRDCEATAMVLVAVAFGQLTDEAFNKEKQLGFRKALALAAGVDVARVVITGVAQAHRATGGPLRVDAQVAAKGVGEAEVVVDLLNRSPLDRILTAEGLSNGQLVSAAVQSDSSTRGDGGGTAWVVGGAVVGGCLLVASLAATAAWWAMRRVESQEQRQLRSEMASLRARLGITRREGYVLSTESLLSWRWLRGDSTKEVVVIPRASLEAAARLGSWQEFDAAHFDALCLCLECGDSRARFEGTLPPAFRALCDWVLEISKALIRPSLPLDNAPRGADKANTRVGSAAGKGKGAKGEEAEAMKCSLRVEERFPFFIKCVSKARIWSSDGGALFKKLKEAAMVYMDDIAALCDRRFEQLRTEEGGEALMAFFTAPGDQEGLVNIRRQDHPEVRAVVVHEEAVREASVLRLARTGSSSVQDEEVFIAQLVFRARLLDPDFQQRVKAVVARHSSVLKPNPASASQLSVALSISSQQQPTNPLSHYGSHGGESPAIYPSASATFRGDLAGRDYSGQKAPASLSGAGCCCGGGCSRCSGGIGMARELKNADGLAAARVDFAVSGTAAAGSDSPVLVTTSTDCDRAIVDSTVMRDMVCTAASPDNVVKADAPSEFEPTSPSTAVAGASGLQRGGPYGGWALASSEAVSNLSFRSDKDLVDSRVQRTRSVVSSFSRFASSAVLGFPSTSLAAAAGAPTMESSYRVLFRRMDSNLFSQNHRTSTHSGDCAAHSTSTGAGVLRCSFLGGGGEGDVEVSAAPIKAAGRMREKLAEYAGEGASWPLAAQILDPVRASVVCQGPAHMLEVASWFLQANRDPVPHQQQPPLWSHKLSGSPSEDSLNSDIPLGEDKRALLEGKFSAGNDNGAAVEQGAGAEASWLASAEHAHRPNSAYSLEVCRVKNKFALDKGELVGSYRDVMLCVVVEGAGGLRIIGEIQIHDKVLHDLKMLMHKLYRIRRAKSAAAI